MKTIINIVVVIFVMIGSALLFAFVIKVTQDGKISFPGNLDLVYAKRIGESAQVLSIVWSIIGVLLIVMTLNIQKEQFLDNRKFIAKQQFETTFFNMLNVLHNIKQAMAREINRGEFSQHLRGQEFIDYLMDDLTTHYKSHFGKISSDSQITTILSKINQNIRIEELEREILREELNKVYLAFYANHHTELGHFFRYLFNLLNFTILSRHKYEDEDIYINLIQAQLSNNELAIIFYNSLSDKSLSKEKKPKFYNILEQYSFFENIDKTALLDRSHHSLFPKTMFKFLNRDEKKNRV